ERVRRHGKAVRGRKDDCGCRFFFQAEDGIRDKLVTGVQTCALPISFRKVERKDDIAEKYRKSCGREEGVVLIGKAQEKTPVFRTERRRNEKTGVTYPWLVRSTAMVNHFYIYVVDRDFGPFFLKFCTYFPYNAKLCLNGHEYVKRQLAQK